MAIEMINVGAAANDGTGDDLREAFIKINQNFEDLDLRIDDKTEGANVGTGAKVYKQRVGYDLQFRSIVEGNNVSVTELDNMISISAVGGLQSLFFVTDSGSLQVADGQTVRIQGGTDITTRWDGQSIRIDNAKVTNLNEDSTPVLGADLDGNQFNISNVGSLTATVVNAEVVGNLTGLVHGIDIRDLNDVYDDFDLGSFVYQISTWYDYLRYAIDVDFGTINSPSGPDIDLGSF